MKTARTEKGFVYVISATNGYVKIGKASNPYERFGTIQTSSPLILTLCYVCECRNPVDIEIAAHQTIAEHRRHREWFEVSPNVAVAAVRAALIAAGFETSPVPHRAEIRTIGAPPVHRADILETALPSHSCIPVADGLIGILA